MRYKFILVLLFSFTINTLLAESKLFIFLPDYPNTEFTISVNGKKIDEVQPPVTKEKNTEIYKQPLKYHEKSYKQIVFNEDGKYVIVVVMSYTNPINLNVIQYQAEFPVIMEEDDIVYLDLCRKGFNDSQIKELDAKKAQKKLNEKNIYALPTTLF